MNEFEEILKKRINRYKSEVDPEEIWEGIQRKRYPQKRKRRFLFVLAAAGILLFLITATFVISKSLGGNNKSKISKSDSVIDSNQIHSPSYTENTFSSNKKDMAGKTQKTSVDIVQTPQKTSSIPKTDFGRKINPLFAGKEEYSNEKGEDEKAKVNKDEIKFIEHKEKEKFVVAYLNSNISLRGNTPKLNFEFIPKVFNNKSIRLPKAEIEFNLTPYYIHRQFSLQNDDATTFMTNKKDSEIYLEAFDISLYYKLPVYKNINVYTGLLYGQIDTKFNYYYKEIKEELKDSVLTKVIINSIVDTVRIYERAKTKNYYDVTEQIYNYHRYLRIPLSVGYSVNLNKLDLEIRAGIDFNIFTLDKGRTITPEGNTVMLSDTKNNLMKKNILGDFSLGLKMNYRLNNQMSLTAGPSYKISTFSQMQKVAGFNLYYHSFGLGVGMQYKFR